MADTGLYADKLNEAKTASVWIEVLSSFYPVKLYTIL